MITRKRVLSLCLAGLTACHSWRHAGKPTPNGGFEGSPEVVRVTRTEGCGPIPTRECMDNRSTVTLYGHRIQGDTLIGYSDRDNRERVAIFMSDITNVETSRFDMLRTTGAVVGGALMSFVIAWFVVMATVMAKS